ncbi:LLM class flavin-dependent oxidoreductase [Baekduia soli]|uniref:LLM class flavin-dependent oxidoreductase n=1 Tax=Baekduia soli TaxID=496014 RepID=A0A5B8U0S9_9ACTN|nr:LLM class flavin-dependent oxidoreductase [Baekduia soli]QEC46455.1 LLM class flavin-dependent oxidoreductase [Baekduia soli]
MPGREDVADTMDGMIEEGIIAEKAGFHSLQVPHRHGRTECYLPGPEQLLTVLARETSKVAIGTFTHINTLYHPMKAAEQYSVIDNLSRGRLYTTVSRGFHPGYWQQFGVPQERMLGRFKEAMKVWQLAFEGERFDFDGDFYQVQQGLLAPQPWQRGGWPIWGGGNASPAAIRRSAEFGDAWTCDPGPLMKPQWDERTGAYRGYAEELGKTPFIVLMRDGWVADSFDDAARAFGTHFVNEMRFYVRQGIYTQHPDFQTEDDITAERVAPHLIMGSPQQCIEQLERYHEEFGVDYFTLRFRMVEGPPLAEVAEQIQRFGEEVVAPIHKKYPAIDHPAIPEACRW